LLLGCLSTCISWFHWEFSFLFPKLVCALSFLSLCCLVAYFFCLESLFEGLWTSLCSEAVWQAVPLFYCSKGYCKGVLSDVCPGILDIHSSDFSPSPSIADDFWGEGGRRDLQYPVPVDIVSRDVQYTLGGNPNSFTLKFLLFLVSCCVEILCKYYFLKLHLHHFSKIKKS
jgi:hypothetical protein